MSCACDQLRSSTAASAIPLRTREGVMVIGPRQRDNPDAFLVLELIREAELAALAERQQELAEEMKLTCTLLPVVNGSHSQETASYP